MGVNFNNYTPVYRENQPEDNDNMDMGSPTSEKPEPDKKTGKKAKKVKAVKEPRESKPLLKTSKIFSDKRVRYVAGFAILLMVLLALISSISYFSTGAADQSLIEKNTILQNAETQEIKNPIGPLGAAVSEFLFNQGFGIGAFCLLYMFGAIGLKCIGYFKYRTSSTVLISLVATITVSSVLGFYEYATDSTSFFALGGAHGRSLTQFMTSVAGTLGCLAFNLLLIAILVALTINSLMRVYNFYKRIMNERKLRKMEEMKKEQELKRNTFDESHYAKPEPVAPQKAASADIVFNQNEKEITDEHIRPLQPPVIVKEKAVHPTNSFTLREPIQDEKEEAEEMNEDEEEFPIASSTVELPSSTPDVYETEVENAGEVGETEVVMNITQGEIEKAETIKEKPLDPTAELSRYKFPPLSLLHDIDSGKPSVDIQEQEENKERITKTLSNYKIAIKSIEVCVGPTVTLYEIIPAEGVRISHIKNLEDDIALSLAALGIRIIAPIPGRGTIGIEVPNKDKRTVSMKSIIESKRFQNCHYELPIAMGCTISNEVFIADLTKMPHILVAGATGQGKSVGLNAIITSLLYKKHPSELKFVMVDPKMVEFSMYSKLEYHYLAKVETEEEPIITDMTKAVNTLNSLVVEMENRLVLLRNANVRNIKEYNAKFLARHLNPEKGHKFMPYIVVIIDELADLIMNIGRKEVETPISRITQKARAVGIHMILATQRPSTDVITGIIKANCPGRIAFRVIAMTDSRIILDRSGAQQLIGRGDMLISYNNELTRVQCAFVDTPEVEAIANYIGEQVGFEEAYPLPEYTPEASDGNGVGSLGSISDRDTLFEEAAAFIVSSSTASTSSLQRRYSIGYNRAGKIMDQLEAAGIVGPSQGGKPRQVLVDSIGLASILNNK